MLQCCPLSYRLLNSKNSKAAARRVAVEMESAGDLKRSERRCRPLVRCESPISERQRERSPSRPESSNNSSCTVGGAADALVLSSLLWDGQCWLLALHIGWHDI